MVAERGLSAGTPLVQKLGIDEGDAVGLGHPPDGFVETLGALPSSVRLVDARAPMWDVSVLFCVTHDDLTDALVSAIEKLPAAGAVWIAWPKKASGVATELTFDDVQQAGLEYGLVDNKICAIDETWSGLRFVVRQQDRSAWPR